MHVLVVTVVHHPLDARVMTREIGALLDAGHQVTYAAPWAATGTSPPPGVTPVDLPRADRRRRLGALRAARRALRAHGADADLILLHNPELLLTLIGRRPPTATVWDVHEDVGAALVDKTWLPKLLRRPAAVAVRSAERWAERSVHLLLAEEGYRPRFARDHPVVPNEPVVPVVVEPPGDSRVLYLGRVSHGRGGAELVGLADRLPPAVDLEILGWAEPEIAAELEAATRRGRLRWVGRIDNTAALERLRGGLAGLSLLHDLPNYRHSRPTKVVEYMAHGLPVITTPNPVAVEIVERHQCGIVVPFGDVGAVAEAIAELRSDAELRARLGAAGHRAALEHYNWAISGPAFVDHLRRWAAG